MNDTTIRYKVQPSEKVEIPKDRLVDCVVQGSRYLEVLYMEKKPRVGTRKISKELYEVLSTGEVKEYNLTDTKQADSLKKTFDNLRWLIRTNFTENSKNQLSITLTYRENMQDHERLMDDFQAFMQRLQYAYKDHKFEYITVAEPQGRGAWHMHLMLKSDQPRLYIDCKDMDRIWRHGATTTKRLVSDDVGQYYVAYFTDLTDETKALKDKPSEEMSKARKKGGRLHLYPKGMRFFRCSRGIKRPTREQKLYEDVKDEYGERPRQSSTYGIVATDEDGKEEQKNTIQRELYDKLRGWERG